MGTDRAVCPVPGLLVVDTHRGLAALLARLALGRKEAYLLTGQLHEWHGRLLVALALEGAAHQRATQNRPESESTRLFALEALIQW